MTEEVSIDLSGAGAQTVDEEELLGILAATLPDECTALS
jgi:hypothetical protein